MITNVRRCVSAVVAVLTVALAVPVGVLSGAAVARADAPGRLDTQVTDRIGALGGGRGAADEALNRLESDTGLELFVVFVDSFDGTPAQTWTDRTAALSGLGDRDALLAVATVDRAYAYSIPPSSALSDAEVDAVARDNIEPALSRSDWSAAVVGAANGYREAILGGGATAVRSSSVGVGSLLCPVAVIAAVLLGGLLWVRGRRRAAARQTGVRAGDAPQATGVPAPAAVSTEELGNRANALLIELDDDLRASERELGLASAQYGAEATARFRTAFDAARQDVAEAFRLRMTLDDTPAVDESARRATFEEIIRRCEAADARLDAESEEFDRLRDLEGRVEQVSDEVDRRRTRLDGELPAAATALQDLTKRYAGTPVTAVTGNVEAARERLAFAADAVGRARASLTGQFSPPGASDGLPGQTSGAAAGAAAPAGGTAGVGGVPGVGGVGGGAGVGGDRAEAALAVRAAEQAVDQAEQLLTAVHQAGADVAAARTAVDGLVTEVQTEVAAGRAALDAGGPAASPSLASAVAIGEQTLSTVRSALAGPVTDPAAAVAQLEAADVALDRALAEVRDAGERLARAHTLLTQALPVARAEVAAAGDFITTRRGAVGGSARAWLSEAQRHLALAESLAGTDPITAVAEAQEAHRLAAAAGDAAREDVQTWSGPGGYGGGYGGAGGFEGALAGAVLGGILSGGGRGGGGYGGGSWGGGSWGGGGFGGSGSRGRRTGGGGFSGGGGGRRGGGGRF